MRQFKKGQQGAERDPSDKPGSRLIAGDLEAAGMGEAGRASEQSPLRTWCHFMGLAHFLSARRLFSA